MKTFPNKILTKSQAEQALDTAVALVRQNLPLYTDHCQNHSSVHDIYPQCENNQWTCGFWPGEVWLSYERTGDAADDENFLAVTDLIAGLNHAAALPLATDQPHLTGDAGAAGPIDCAANRVMSVAYWVVVSLKDADNDGIRLDAPHTLSGLCAASPAAAPRFGSDDVVVAESPAQLAGWLRKSLP